MGVDVASPNWSSVGLGIHWTKKNSRWHHSIYRAVSIMSATVTEIKRYTFSLSENKYIGRIAFLFVLPQEVH
jgi:hypothetical protein